MIWLCCPCDLPVVSFYIRCHNRSPGGTAVAVGGTVGVIDGGIAVAVGGTVVAVAAGTFAVTAGSCGAATIAMVAVGVLVALLGRVV